MLANNPDPRGEDATAMGSLSSRANVRGCWCEPRTETGVSGEILVLRVSGEIDVLTEPMVLGVLDIALFGTVGWSRNDLVVDLGEVTFCSVGGFTLLRNAARTAADVGIIYALCGLSAQLERCAAILWADEHLSRHLDVAAAVTTIRAEQTYHLTTEP